MVRPQGTVASKVRQQVEVTVTEKKGDRVRKLVKPQQSLKDWATKKLENKI